LTIVLFWLFSALLSPATESATPLEWANKAEQLIRSGHSQEGLEALMKAAEMPGASAESEDRIGFLFAVLGRRAEAADHFEKSISLNGAYAPAHYHLGVARWLEKDTDRGLPELQEAAKLQPSVFDYRYRLGSAYLELGRHEEASSELNAAVAIDRSQVDAWKALGQALRRKPDFDGAVDAYRRAVELNPNDNETRNGYATLLIEARYPERAIKESEQVLRRDPANAAAQMNIGYAYLKIGEFDKAETAYRAAVADDPKSPAAHYDLAIALKMKDQLEAAQKEFRAAIELDPSLAEAHYTLGITYWQLGDFPATKQEMKAAIAARPDYAEAHYTLGIVLKQSGDLDGALSELREAIRLDPTTPGPFNALGQILRIKGDKQGSEEAFATGARLKREKEHQLADTLEQGMRGGSFPKPLAGSPR
jgi:tetratricopeptide (TPR) repeat protein